MMNLLAIVMVLSPIIVCLALLYIAFVLIPRDKRR